MWEAEKWAESRRPEHLRQLIQTLEEESLPLSLNSRRFKVKGTTSPFIACGVLCYKSLEYNGRILVVNTF